jgi:hypothetical protein
MHDIINTGLKAHDAYTEEDGEAIIEEEEEEAVEEGGEYEEEMSQSPPPRPRPRQRGRRRRHPRREKAAEVQSGDLWRMNASPRRGRR